ncbi:MAG TPA: UDP-N-acetylmuramate dehydrogenase [Patescibacteria group bacterium]|jgi:UDP-N-acetylmuramate dehydrogenase|nr:UDP-N-acetylmuramate dehydrogenase [Patescibacteria group bacterium]
MNIQTNIALKDYTTMRIGGPAKSLVTVHSKSELIDALEWAADHRLPIFMLGEGSNVIARDEGFNGLVIINRLTGFEVLQETEKSAVIRIAAGEHWDNIVARTVGMGLSGIEKLSMIPGTAGATPVQNVGAYGSEIADTLVELEVYNQLTNKFITLSNADCHFSYRNSIFKPMGNRHYVITNITLKLSKASPEPPFYKSLNQYLDDHSIVDFTPQNIRQAVMNIRASKLPDPKLLANTGSFFKNPIISQDRFDQLLQDYPDMSFYDMPDNKVKLAAGWLIDKTGLKSYRAHGMKLYENNALVFVNESAKSYQDLASFKAEVIEKVQEKFGIVLEQEPETI